MDKQRVVILLGGTGFIGSALAAQLVRRGENVVSVARHLPNKQENGIEYYACDTADSETLNEIIRKGDDIFILTGQVGPGFDAEQEKESLRNITDVLAYFPEKKAYYASSVYVYGNTDSAADEAYPCQPIEAYSKFKLEVEQLLQESLPDNDLIIFRLANVYGSPKNRGVIGLAINKLFAPDGTPLRINGDGNQKRDYIFLDDMSEAMVAVKERCSGSDTVNIALGESLSLLDVIGKIAEIVGKQIPYEVTNVTLNEIRDMYVSNEKLKRVYGYEPKTSIESGLRRTLEQYQELYQEAKSEFKLPTK